ncbi:hypothetical protein BKA70DRAFT_1023298, partial [Coprinopsis sp. MPI-PUGE-AT-0042]
FPPNAPSDDLLHRVIDGFCQETGPEYFQESGCCVCSGLYPMPQLVSWSLLKIDTSVLCNPGVTRVERHSIDDPLVHVEGPILDDCWEFACVPCVKALKRKHRPLMSLANGMWIGDVPTQLRGLTLAEQLLISRIRHNRCLVRVTSGRAKMIANVIMFTNPTAHVY